ncbi:MAG: hypothetical protein V7K15_18330 [Nostoc sp.]
MAIILQAYMGVLDDEVITTIKSSIDNKNPTPARDNNHNLVAFI